MKGWLNMLKVTQIAKHSILQITVSGEGRGRNKLVFSGFVARNGSVIS